MRPHFRILHTLESGLGHVEATTQIGAHHIVPVVIAHVQQCAVAGDAGIVDDDIDRADIAGNLRAGGQRGFVVTNVELVGRDAGFLGEIPCRLVIAGIAGDHGETVAAQGFADCTPDPARAPGDDRYMCHFNPSRL